MASTNLTEYERRRLENIRRNDEMMAALNIFSKASQLSASSKRQRVKSLKSFKISPEKKKPKSDSPIVIRRSLRTRGMPPDSKGLDGDLVETPNKIQMPSKGVEEPSPSVNGPFCLRDAYCGTGSDRTLMDTISSLQKKPSVKFNLPIKKEDVKMEPSNEVLHDSVKLKCEVPSVKKEEDYCVDVWSMKLKPDNTARVMPGRIMVVKFLPCNAVGMIAAGNKEGNVAFWKFDNANEDEDGIYLYRLHTAPVSGIFFHQSSLSKVFTSGYDGYLRLLNVEKEAFDLIYSCDDAIFSLSQRPSDMNGLYIGEGYVELKVLDERTGKVSSQWMLHEKRINSIDFNSQNPNIMATSSTDGTACLWDLRLVNAKKPKCLTTVKHNRAVHSAYFSPSGSFLATTSADDTVGIFNCTNFEDKSLIYHDNQTGRWISSFRSIWGWDDSHVYIGNMKRGVDVISRTQKRSILTLESPYISAIPCRFDIHPYNTGMLAGATGGGQIYMWTSS